MLWLALTLSILAARAQDVAATLSPKEAPFKVKVPTPGPGDPGWSWRVDDFPMEGDPAVTLTRPGGRPPIIAIGFMEGRYQPDLVHADLSKLAEQAARMADDTFPLDQLQTSMVEDAHLGAGVRFEISDAEVYRGARADLRMAIFPIAQGGLMVVGAAPSGKGELDAAFTSVLAMIQPSLAALPTSELPYGHVEAEAGYSLDLPEGWRALTRDEMRAIDPTRIDRGAFEGKLVHQAFVDPAAFDPVPWFACSATTEGGKPLEVLDPAKSQLHADNYRARTRSILRGGAFRVQDGAKVKITQVELTEGSPVQVDREDPGNLQLVDLGDRDAYLWRVDGKVSGPRGEESGETAVTALTFFTAYDEVSLDCIAVAGPDLPDLPGQFEAAMRSLRVTDGEAHPMKLSWSSQYTRAWPFTHPLLQLYWLPIPLALLALWLAVKSD